MKSESQIKRDIIECYRRFRDSAGPGLESERQKHFARLVSLVFTWCSDYPFFVKRHKVDAREAGVEIFQTVKSCAAQPLDASAFIPYLKKSLERAWWKYHAESEAALIRIPAKKAARAREIERVLEIAGRPLSAGEAVDIIAKWYNVSREKAQACIDLCARTRVESLDNFHDPGSAGTPHDIPDERITASCEAIDFRDAICIREAVETAFAGKQERARAMIRKLFTLKHIKELLDIDFAGESPAIDAVLLAQARKGEKLPAQYEIILADSSHHFADKASASVYASKELRKFEKKLREALADIWHGRNI